MIPTHQEVADKIDEIVNEMKRLGLWEQEPASPDEYDFERHREGDRLFTHWLQYQFIPRVLRTVQKQGEFPAKSRVAVQAAVEFDGYDEDTMRLLELLREFDAMFE